MPPRGLILHHFLEEVQFEEIMPNLLILSQFGSHSTPPPLDGKTISSSHVQTILVYPPLFYLKY
ncbi:hypothetical protein HanPI659440_Chr14g0525331 [Helianthus annuus]|nr:hypothetical protein HanPI659440_Chr14g0525331 [Helianthus annuus]